VYIRLGPFFISVGVFGICFFVMNSRLDVICTSDVVVFRHLMVAIALAAHTVVLLLGC